MTDTLQDTTASKACTKCKIVKVLGDYYAHKPAKDGRQSWCKDCHKEEARQRYAVDPVKKKASIAAWAKANPEKVLHRTSTWRRANPEKSAAYARSHHQRNPEQGYERCGTRRAAKRNATPAWANRFVIREAYRLAQLRSKMTGFTWHVDHIVPLTSPLVCGLHCEANLQVIPAVVNLAKGNRF